MLVRADDTFCTITVTYTGSGYVTTAVHNITDVKHNLVLREPFVEVLAI